LASEIVAFTAEDCGADSEAAFRQAAANARAAGESWKSRVYLALSERLFAPQFGESPIAKKLEVPPGSTSFVLGASKIVVGAGSSVGAQVERRVRDWLSYQLDWDERSGDVAADRLITWHEGARLRDLAAAAPIKIVPLTGAIAVRHGGRWLGADANGVFRY